MKYRFYTKQAIGLLALFLSPFFACILFAYNLKEIGKGKLFPFFIFGGLVYTAIVRQLTHSLGTLFQILILNVVGSLLLTYYFWDKYLGAYNNYERKDFWKPTLIFIGICVVLLLAQVFTSRK